MAAVKFLILLAVLQQAEAGQDPKPKPRVKRPNPVYGLIKDVAGLPRVLLLGDSISVGYTLKVRALMKGKANVHRARENCGPTTKGLDRIDAWLGKGKWDVIHFNFGLHDLKFVDDKLKNTSVDKGHYQVEPKAYEKNLRALVARLKKTGARLIWCSTTPVPKGSRSRIEGDAVKYNKVAAKVMKEEKIPVNDLHAFAMKQLAEIQRPKNVHFFPAGSAKLAARVVEKINGQLGR